MVRALLRDQHPSLADLPLRHLASGWDNEVFRLGEEYAVRMPRRPFGAAVIEHELRWLPELAPRLPLPVPTPLRAGRPGHGFPWSWSITPWLPGDIAARAPSADPAAAAAALGGFVAAMGRPAPTDAPSHHARGVPLAARHTRVRGYVEALDSEFDGAAVLQHWDRALAVPPYDSPPVWLHGDLHPANILVNGGLLSAIIDFGDLTAGDPATDLSVAWMLFDPSARAVFREAAGGCDDATWDRARGNALAHALASLSASDDDPVNDGIGRATLAAVLAD